ncbi:hypothetical protein Bca52824_004247 [Brassica carinata]|uniref:DUF7725 domain-containing protein n=1 Tax=Brassica carinata TaxID=52824 RepID=A0A8X8BFD3_BRACI|nr:hypothetical protein Bca52824_004247 [Brassica carinata]
MTQVQTKQIRTLSRQQGELQQQEVELRARMLAMEIQRSFESRSAEYENAAARMQEQLRENDRSIREMERKLEEKERELHAVKLDNEAAWEKEGLLREQNKELATLRRERDHSEAEMSQSLHKISELQEHVQEKERQFAELQEQNRIAQETIMYKDEQLREAQGWIARAQEMDALQSSTNHSLQAELRERTEQYNQLWLGCQRQAVPASSEMPRQNYVHPSQAVHGLVSSDAKSEHQVPVNGQSLDQRVVESGNASENNFQDISSQFRDALRLDSSAINQKPEEVNGQVSPGEPNGVGSVARETLVSSGKSERNMESALLDERSLLACIVRTIPAGGRIRISSTLPNRLGKMLAPLHWHDYRKKYGKLEDFVANHLELFVIEDDYIQVREGAQKMVAASASAAASKVAISSSPSSMYVAMTPLAQSQGLKKNVQRGRQSSDYMAPQQRKL